MCGKSTALGVEEALQTGLGLSESTPGDGMMAGWVLPVRPRILEHLARLLRVHSLSWCRAVLSERAWGPKTVGKEEGRKGGGKKGWPESKGKASLETARSCSVVVPGNHAEREAETNEPQ